MSADIRALMAAPERTQSSHGAPFRRQRDHCSPTATRPAAWFRRFVAARWRGAARLP